MGESPYTLTIYFFFLSLLLSNIVYCIYLYYLYYNKSLTYPISNQSIKNLLITSLTFLWYCISITLTVYNKWILGTYGGGFDYPITTTSIHMIIKYIFTRVWLYTWHRQTIPELSNKSYFFVIIPIGLTTALDIAFSNESVSMLTISLYTIIKTTVVVWTFLWGYIFALELFSYQKVASISFLVFGLSIAVLSNQLQANITGIMFCLLAAVCGSLRWALIQLLVMTDITSKHPLVALYRFSFSSVVTILPLVFIFEYNSLINSIFFTSDWLAIGEVFTLMSIGGLISCALIIVEIHLVNLTSSLTLSILGQLKEVIQIIFGMIAFKDSSNVYTIIGVTIAVLSAEYYRQVKILERISQTQTKDSTPVKSQAVSINNGIVEDSIDSEEGFEDNMIIHISSSDSLDNDNVYEIDNMFQTNYIINTFPVRESSDLISKQDIVINKLKL